MLKIFQYLGLSAAIVSSVGGGAYMLQKHSVQADATTNVEATGTVADASSSQSSTESDEHTAPALDVSGNAETNASVSVGVQ